VVIDTPTQMDLKLPKRSSLTFNYHTKKETASSLFANNKELVDKITKKGSFVVIVPPKIIIEDENKKQ
jgi:hypothetical protein